MPACAGIFFVFIGKTSMRFIPTKLHGILDYLYVIALFFVPNIFGFSSNSADTYATDVAACAVLVYSIHTKYELGIFKNIPMRIHLLLDFIVGILLAASPWLFAFADVVYKPHLFFGLFAIAAALLSKKSSKQIDESTYAEHN